MKKKVYLCGGIENLDGAAIHGWRERAKALLGIDYEAVDPTRKMLPGESTAAAVARMGHVEIVEQDLADIHNCEVLLCKVDAPSWGTAMEIAAGYMCRKTVVLFVTDRGSKIESPFLHSFSQFRFGSLEEAVAKVNTL